MMFGILARSRRGGCQPQKAVSTFMVMRLKYWEDVVSSIVLTVPNMVPKFGLKLCMMSKSFVGTKEFCVSLPNSSHFCLLRLKLNEASGSPHLSAERSGSDSGISLWNVD